MIILGLAAVVLLLGIIAVFSSGKTWRWHTILAVLLLIATGTAMLILSAKTLKTHKEWMNAATNMRRSVEDVEGVKEANGEDKDRKDNIQLAYDVKQLRAQIRDTIADRGRVWIDCKRTNPGAENEIVVTVDQPEPHQITEKTSMFVFDSDDQGFGTYVGEFRVAKVAGKSITLVPIFPVDAREATRIKQTAPSTRNSITLFEQMPSDSHEAFAGMNDEALRGVLPGAANTTLDEYARDLQPAGINDPPENIEVRVKFLKDTPIAVAPGAKAQEPKMFKEGQEVWLPLQGSATVPGAEALIRQGAAEEVRTSPRRNVRPLREYKVLFDQAYQDRTLLKTAREQVTRDRDSLVNAQTAAENQIKQEGVHKDKLNADLDKLKAELLETNNLLRALENQWNAVRSELGRVFLENRQMADQLSSAQAKAAADLRNRSDKTASAPALTGARIP